MANALSAFPFTNGPDTASSSIGWDAFAGQTIKTLAGDDSITGTIATADSGIYNEGTINTGRGNDSLIGEALNGGIGIANLSAGIIDTGSGSDVIIGRGQTGILNNGLISTGAGNDIVDALIGGFDGAGTVDLGANDDTLKGFGNGYFKGGRGTDTIALGEGTYTFSNGIITLQGSDEAMIVTGFEWIQGANDSIKIGLYNATYVVNSSGFML